MANESSTEQANPELERQWRRENLVGSLIHHRPHLTAKELVDEARILLAFIEEKN